MKSSALEEYVKTTDIIITVIMIIQYFNSILDIFSIKFSFLYEIKCSIINKIINIIEILLKSRNEINPSKLKSKNMYFSIAYVAWLRSCTLNGIQAKNIKY